LIVDFVSDFSLATPENLFLFKYTGVLSLSWYEIFIPIYAIFLLPLIYVVTYYIELCRSRDGMLNHIGGHIEIRKEDVNPK
jgi:hypothetical protein